MSATDLKVRYVADLARIDLTPEEEDRFSAQLGDILGYVKQLETLDLDGIEPTAHATPIQGVTRPDVAHDTCLSQEDALRNAPHSANGQFVVPKVIE